MQKFLIDTHYLIWAMKNPEKISKKALEIIEDKNNEVFVSLVSLWEIAIKQKIGKIELLDNLKNFKKDVEQIGFIWLPILDIHIFTTMQLQLHQAHKDPFDRLIISQAIQENLTIITDDKKFNLYSEIKSFN